MPAGFSTQTDAGYQTKTVDSKSFGPKCLRLNYQSFELREFVIK